MADGQVVFEITGNNDGIKRVLSDTTTAIKNESDKWDDAAEDSTKNIEGSFGTMLKNITGAITAAAIGKKLLGLSAEAIQLASDLEEVQNVVDVTFGENAGKIDQWAKSAGESFGLTELQAKRFSSTIGAMLKSSGVEGDITDMSTSLAGLAADMASFYNLDFQTAFDKIRAGISGEIEPLRQLGINMSVANLEAYAMSQGIEKSYSDMSQAEQTMLRYNYLLGATADAQGDFERTGDSYANSIRRLETSIAELKATIGEGLLGPVTEAVNAINDLFGLLINPEKTLSEKFDEINDATDEAVYSAEYTADNAREYAQILEQLGDPTSFMGVLASQTEELNKKQQDWLATCRELVGIIPELSEVINAQTGDVQGGAAAVQEYIDSWEARQRADAALAAIQEKQALLDEQYGNVRQMEVELGVAEKRMENLKRAYDEAGGDEQLQYYNFANPKLMSDEEREQMNAFYETYTKFKGAEDEVAGLSSTLESVREDYAAAEEELQEYAQAAMDWVKEVDQSGTAETNAAATVNGIANGISSATPAVAAAVGALNSVLGGIGGGLFGGGTFKIDGSHATGLDYVPFNNYLAQLHEGESILTAEEARVWRSFKNGGQSVANTIDYEAMGGVMRENIKPGGNVYLDGRIVGQVISQHQGNSLRTLERSGWQR